MGNQQVQIAKILDNQKLNKIKQGLGFTLTTKTTFKECQEGTRTEILSEVDQWASNSSPDPYPLLWITGPPGIGKSTLIETWVQKALENEKHPDAIYSVGAYYSFSGTQDKGMKDCLVSIIVKLIEKFQPTEELDAIAKIIEDNVQPQFLPSPAQMENIVQRTIMGAMKHSSNPFIILGIDALDECEESSIEKLAEMVSDIVMGCRSYIKLIICSRYGVAMQTFNYLFELEEKILEHMDLAESSTEDIRIYIQAKKEELRKKYPKNLSTNWSSDKKAEEIAEAAQGLFIWVKTAFGKSITAMIGG